MKALLAGLLLAGISLAQTPATPPTPPTAAPQADASPDELIAYWKAQALYQEYRANTFEHLYMSVTSPTIARQKDEADVWAAKITQKQQAAAKPAEPAKK